MISGEWFSFKSPVLLFYVHKRFTFRVTGKHILYPIILKRGKTLQKVEGLQG